jgi:hypothetical protein
MTTMTHANSSLSRFAEPKWDLRSRRVERIRGRCLGNRMSVAGVTPRVRLVPGPATGRAEFSSPRGARFLAGVWVWRPSGFQGSGADAEKRMTPTRCSEEPLRFLRPRSALGARQP